MSNNVELLLPVFMRARAPSPVGVLRHTYSITSVTGRGVTGYWFNRVGSITDSTYTLPNSVTAIIRQTMILGEELRFLLSAGGLTVNSADQFPIRIVATRGANSVTFVRSDPLQINTFGQGTGIDYVVSEGTIAGVFGHNVNITVQLYY